MKQFASLFRSVDETTKTTNKINALVAYFEKANHQDKLWLIALFTGKRPKGLIKNSLLKEWIIELNNIPYWLFEQSYHIVGDLAETIALLSPKTEQSSSYSLTEVIQKIIALKKEPDETKKGYVLNQWSSMTKDEVFVFNKLITGGFRIGISQKTITKALAKHLKIEENTIAHRLMGNWDPSTTSFDELLLSENSADNDSRPYPFYLAYALEQEPEEIGNTEDWIAEKKWDGIRGQIIIRNNELYVWSRGEELVTDKFPEFKELIGVIPNGTVLDGEIIGYKQNAPLGFNKLQKRIARKNITKQILEDVPVKMIVYDVLEFVNKDRREQPLIGRKKILKLIFQNYTSNKLILSRKINFKTWSDLKTIRAKSRELHCEGIMLKKKNSIYQVGRKKGDWWKWKIEPLVIDAVLIYAMRGHGRRANLYTDYTFAVWDNEKLVTFCKAYSGLTDVELKEIDKFIKKNTIERFGPVRSVKPLLVFEIAFEGIAKSSRHKSGIAVRFPRINRQRLDKKAKEANTIQDLHDMLTVYGG